MGFQSLSRNSKTIGVLTMCLEKTRKKMKTPGSKVILQWILNDEFHLHVPSNRQQCTDFIVFFFQYINTTNELGNHLNCILTDSDNEESALNS